MTNNNWSSLLANPRGHTVRRYLADLLQGRYGPHDQIVERVAAGFQTDGDMQAFTRFALELFEAGYVKAVEDHRAELAKVGLKAAVRPRS